MESGTIGYVRDVKYREFTGCNGTRRIDCDYMINIGDQSCFIEIAGFIDSKDGKWELYDYKNKTQNSYRDKMIMKKHIMESYCVDYMFLFTDDFDNDAYVYKFKEFISNKNVG